MSRPQLYFENSEAWYEWLKKNHETSNGVNLIFYKLETGMPTMRWEEAVRVALCFGWIDSTVKSLGDGKRQQVYTKRKAKSVWSAVNKKHIEELIEEGLFHETGHQSIKIAKKNGSWESLDDVENGVMPEDLQLLFDKHPKALENYNNFAPSYRKSYLYWLNQAKREATRETRINQIIEYCSKNIKTRG